VVCFIGSSRKLLHHEVVKFTASDQLAFDEKSLHAVASPFLQADHHMSRQEETDSSWEGDELAEVNYTLAYDMAMLESEPEETTAGTGHEGMVDATADISKLPSKNDL